MWDIVSYMDRTTDTRGKALADHLRALRQKRELTLQELANISGVSRATLSRVENGEVSPTAETLGKMATAFAIPLSQLLAPMETDFAPLVRRSQQVTWADPVNGFVRRSISPPSGYLRVEVIECEIQPAQRITYDQPAFPGHEHHLLLLNGALTLTIDGARYELQPGDCLRYRLRGASSFETGRHAARYILAMA